MCNANKDTFVHNEIVIAIGVKVNHNYSCFISDALCQNRDKSHRPILRYGQ